MGSDIIKISHLTKNFGDVKAVNAGYVVILDKRSIEKNERRWIIWVLWTKYRNFQNLEKYFAVLFLFFAW